MFLLSISIILSLVVFSLISSLFPKYGKIFVLVSLIIVFSSYFFLSKNFFHTDNFYPLKIFDSYVPCGNYYNILADRLKKGILYIDDDSIMTDLKTPDIHRHYRKFLFQKKLIPFLDTSYYKGKVYLYYGLTPVILFYLPFNTVKGYFLTDKFLVLILSCAILLLSFLLLRILLLSSPIFQSSILPIFYLGFCSLLPFLVIRSYIYEVAISTAMTLLLCSFVVFYFYLNCLSVIPECLYRGSRSFSLSFPFFQSSAHLIFLMSLFLSLAVGARPHYVLFIPVFFTAVCLMNYHHTKNVKFVIKQAVIFLVPCIVIGAILALYNYLRFDSIFEFGWKYQLNDLRQYAYYPTLKDFFIGLRNNLFCMPGYDSNTFFALAKTHGHRIGNEGIIGVLWAQPIIIFLLYLPYFLKKSYKQNKSIFTVVSVMICVIIINMIVTSFIGMINRYLFEYLLLMIILSIVVYIFIYNEMKNKYLKFAMNILFLVIFVYSAIVQTGALLCKENDFYYHEDSTCTYQKLFKDKNF